MSFETVRQFENKISNYFGAKYGVSVDSCTHGIELCLRLLNSTEINCPTRTYISIPFLAEKLNIKRKWNYEIWKNFYYLTDKVIDAAVLWKKNSYIPNTLMSLSFQFQKHLSLGRGGMILTDNADYAIALKKMSYDGRVPDVPWRNQDINSIGYHYYMTPETAQLGLDKFNSAVETTPRQWKYEDWPDLTKMKIFK